MKQKMIIAAIIPALLSLAFSDAELETCALGEARGEGIKGMTAISESIRNRKTLSGVYGCRADLSRVTSAERASARKAVKLSRTSRLVLGADHWGNAADVKIFRRSAWFKNCKKTAKIGNHYFFKCTQPKTKKREK